MKAVAIYVRVSTFDKQENGLWSQEKALEDYCENKGFTNLRWYRDKISGAKLNRPAFDKLQKDIFAGKVGTVVCWKLDRLSRSLKDGVSILTDWIKQGIRVISITQQIDFEGAVGQLIASVLFAVAAMERETLRENTKRGMAAAKARGVRLGKRPVLFAKDIVPLLQEGLSIADVALKFNKTTMGIYACLKREGINYRQYVA